MTRKLIAALAILAASAAAFAMTDLDANGDGGLSMDELLAAYPDMTEAQFLESDANADGVIDEDELAAAREAGLIPAEQG